MAITYVNTTEIESIASDLISLSNEYIDEINKLFVRLSEVPSETKEWTGTQANKYYNVISSDKQSFLEVGNKMRYIGNKIKSDSMAITNCMNKCFIDEGKRGY